MFQLSQVEGVKEVREVREVRRNQRMYHFGKLRMYTSADYRLAKSKAQALTSSVAITPERSQTAITSKAELAKLK